jgi:RNA polymerase sigma-70 factor (ECF subfamily)
MAVSQHILESAVAEPLSIERLFREHFADVYRALGRMLGPGADVDDIEDLTQQVFISAEKALPRFRGDAKPMTWLYGIAHRSVLMFLRSRRRRRKMIDSLRSEPAPTGDPTRRIEQRDELRRVWRELMEIKPQKRLALVLFEVEGLSAAEIAEVMNVAENTVWTRLHHARRELSERLERRTRRERRDD